MAVADETVVEPGSVQLGADVGETTSSKVMLFRSLLERVSRGES